MFSFSDLNICCWNNSRHWNLDEGLYLQRSENDFKIISVISALFQYANQNPGLTRSHLDFEVKRLRETMHQSFGSNEEITQRRENKLQRLRQIDAELVALQQQREQVGEKI